MSSTDLDRVFAGSVPKLYETYLVPLIFEPYAIDIANRLVVRNPSRVLEIAAGTGSVTRRLASSLPETCRIVATDLNQAMLDYASSTEAGKNVDWRQADAMQLPFEDHSFDAVVCQFGAMFFPDKVKAFSEARRVLEPGGVFIFSVWDRIEENEFADVVTARLAELFPDDPPRFLARTPHGYSDVGMIEKNVRDAGFANIEIATVTKRSRAESPRVPAIGYCEGTPLRNEIIARDASRLAEATDVATDAIASIFGEGDIDGKIQAYVVTTTS